MDRTDIIKNFKELLEVMDEIPSDDWWDCFNWRVLFGRFPELAKGRCFQCGHKPGS